MSSAAGVTESMAPVQGAGPGPSPRAALHALQVSPIPAAVARRLVERNHYLHSMPGGTRLAFGVLLQNRLLGAATLGVGPTNAHRLVEGAIPGDCITLTRLWLSDELPTNSESRVVGIVLRALRRHTALKFVVSYADPSEGHVGTIYQALGWTYTGLSEPSPLYDLGDGRLRHSRSLGHAYGTRSVAHLRRHGVDVKLRPQSAKHRYIHFLDPLWGSRLRVPALPYPRREVPGGSG